MDTSPEYDVYKVRVHLPTGLHGVVLHLPTGRDTSNLDLAEAVALAYKDSFGVPVEYAGPFTVRGVKQETVTPYQVSESVEPRVSV